MRDPYALLGVQRDAGDDEIKAAWRSKAKSIHPDHNRDDPSATMRFAEIGQAYELLKDPDKRSRYDRQRQSAEARQRQRNQEETILQQREAARQAAARAKAAKENAERVMEELARANAKRAASHSAGDAASGESPEDMIERIFGTQAQPEGQGQEQTRTHAQGSARIEDEPNAAAADDTSRRDGSPKGDAGAEQKTPLPLQAVDLIASLVRRIRGGAAAPEKAPDLSAEATVTVEDLLKRNPVTIMLSDDREVRFLLEPGMTDGHVVRLKGQGLRVQGLQRGDLVVTLRLAREERYRVDGYDIHTILPIALEDAVLGSKAEVETPEGMRSIDVPAWSGSDRTIRLEGSGLFNEAGGRGDLVVELRVVLWEKPDAKVTDLMRHMRQGLYI